MAKVRKKLGEILVDSGLITEDILNKALILQKQSGEKLGEFLVNGGFVTEDQIVEAIKNQLGIQSINLDNIIIKPEIIDIMPEAMARKHEVLPVDIINGQLLVAMSDPLNYFAIEDIKMGTGYITKTSIALRRSILSNIEKYYGKNRAQEAAEDYGRVYGNRINNNQENEVIDENSAPIIKFINTIIENAILNNSSDIHIEPDEIEMRVRFRVDGVLMEIMRSDIGMLEAVISRLKIMAGLNIAEKRIPQDGRINFKAKQKNIDLRISVVPTMWGEKVVMRLLDKTNFSLSLGKIGLEEKDLEKLNRIISKPYGIILVSGPTGSGKTTTLYSILNVLNDVSKNIITIEDPVEYYFKGITQMQVNNKIGFDFSTGLKSILRQDPDVILVGEIRDAETAEISVRSALTGHLVLSSIHTNTAIGAITRLEDMGIAPFLISSTITGIVAQRLVRKICPNCAEEYISDEREMKILDLKEPVKLKKGTGCSFCNHKGYKGRIGIFEIIEVDKDLKLLIDNKASQITIEDREIEKGNRFLRGACIEKVLKGIVSVEEMLRVTYGY